MVRVQAGSDCKRRNRDIWTGFSGWRRS
jgi:hypothetical protein